MTEASRNGVNWGAYAADFGMTVEQFREEFATYLKDKPKPRAVGLLWKNARDQIAITKSPAVVDKLLYKGAITVLFAKPKAGKTTLVLDIIATVLEGQPVFKEEVVATSVLYVSEQGHASFRAELANSGLLAKVQPELSETHAESLHYVTIEDWFGLNWKEIVKGVLNHAVLVKAGLVVFDTISRIAGIEEENSASEVQKMMNELTPLTAEGISVLVIQHERKGGGELADAGRGSGALTGAVDMVLRLTRTGGNNPENQRKLEMLGRFPSPDEPRILERSTADSRSRYVLQGMGDSVAKMNVEQGILDLYIGIEDEEFTQEEILEEMVGKASRTTTRRAINSLVVNCLLKREGAGRKEDPFRFKLRKDGARPVF